ncbi:channel protein TolC [Burkholderia stagnalis]|uniref:TolC family outer membrane protein n=1 Tax=Burkholderia stagnalis TaxID=1503054 RepID=A0A6L3N290_9BURK|nr:TolC family outer membrane protein [Burkholderia stagnalis]KAB0639819.1 TolC family outer membrane protein [Burkholderia stagnalis]KVO41056.1 channel protein TolC [Burkholderia stagnalis]KVO68563.1 channel protein TolC [Burkholderia stagnalis]KVW63932.1 channel protein TolC [Burkholderia stagnalis]KVW73726.1 channel protein TolC [Burkholderia stagnalis]
MNRNCPLLAVLALASALAAASSLAAAQSLQEAVEQAIRTNPEVRATTYNREAADQGLKQARAGYWPRVDVDASIGKEQRDDVETRLLGLNRTTFTHRNANVTLSQMLFDGFAVRSEVARQQARIDSSANRVASTSEDVALRVVGAYLEVLRRRETTAAAEDNLESHRRIHDQIKLRSDRGVGRRADLYQAESRLALAQDNLRTEQSSLKDAEVAYARLVGSAPDALVKPVAPEGALPPTERLALDAALANHPSLAGAEADVAQARARYDGAKAALWPRLDLELSASHDRDGVLGPTNDRRVMLRLRYNLFQGGADKARIGEAHAQIREAEEERNRTRLEIQESVSHAYNAYLTARDRMVVLKQYVDSSAATREAYMLQFGIGQRSLLDLLNAENEYYSARIDYIGGQYAEAASAYRVFAGMGQLLDTLHVGRPAEAWGAGSARPAVAFNRGGQDTGK